MSKFITFEGIDGAGKSTQTKLLAQRLESYGVSAKKTFEPGATVLGVILRKILLGDLRPAHEMDPHAKACLFLADRTQHLADVIEPALEEGMWVICDRYIDSQYAYRMAEGMSHHDLRLLDAACPPRIPDLTFLLEIGAAKSIIRTFERDGHDPQDGEERHPFPGYLDKVALVYGILADLPDNRNRVVRVDAERPQDQIIEDVWRHVRHRLLEA